MMDRGGTYTHLAREVRAHLRLEILVLALGSRQVVGGGHGRFAERVSLEMGYGGEKETNL
jgi:hypothetical protein